MLSITLAFEALRLRHKSPQIKCRSNEVRIYFYTQQCMNQKDRIVPHGEGEMERPATQAPLGKPKQLHHSMYNLTTYVPPRLLL